MKHQWLEVRQLAELLEAEAAGLPFDRERVRHLASRLAEQHPGINRSMRLICERVSGGLSA